MNEICQMCNLEMCLEIDFLAGVELKIPLVGEFVQVMRLQ